MTITTMFENIGWGEHAHDEIKIIENYSPSNSYEGTDVEINGKYAAGAICTSDAVYQALGKELGNRVLEHMH